MLRPGQSSFRRILLSRILLLSVPVLLFGLIVTYQKVRSSLLETARQNLVESAIRKREGLQSAIKSLKATLVTASEAAPLKSGSLDQANQFLQQLQEQLPTQVQCLQLLDLQRDQLVISSCGNSTQAQSLPMGTAWTAPLDTNPLTQSRSPVWDARDRPSPILPVAAIAQPVVHTSTAPGDAFRQLWPADQGSLNRDRSLVEIASSNPQGWGETVPHIGQLSLVLHVPIYDFSGQLRYALSVHTALHQQERDQPGSLSGYTVVLDQTGTILAHPSAERVGHSIQEEADASELQALLDQAIATGNSDTRSLFNFKENGTEWLAGYSPIRITISPKQQQTWVVLAVARLDNALYGLEEIKQILVFLTIGLVATIFLSTLYVARDLSLPLELLGSYALKIQRRHTNPASSSNDDSSPDFVDELGETPSPEPDWERVPQNFGVRELNQLAQALDSMVQRLEERAEELEFTWREAEAANQLKSQFLANTSHELRTPLNAIIGCIRLVRDGCCDGREEEQEFLQRADDAAIHLLNIINDLLNIAKIEAGKLPVTLEPVDLHQVLRDVVDLQTIQAQQKNLVLRFMPLPDETTVQADAAKLRQVLINVVGNAIKFTEQGEVAIAASLESISDLNTEPESATHWVIISVTDTGIGIDPLHQAKLFRPFMMVDGTTTRRFEGTGLGLAISRNFVELMGGAIALRSSGLGQGTTVEIRLPLVAQKSVVAIPAPVPVAPKAPEISVSVPVSHRLIPGWNQLVSAYEVNTLSP